MKILKKLLFIPGIILFLIVIFPVMIFIGIFQIYEKIRLKIFLSKNNGFSFFIWSSNRGWHDLVVNNVISVLPENVKAINDDNNFDCEVLKNLTRSNIFSVSRPYIASVVNKKIVTSSLNEELFEFKVNSKKSFNIQNKVQVLLASS